MIEFLRGHVAYAEADYLVLDVQGVGYQLFCAHPHRFAQHEQLTIYTHHHVREDAVQLYGFADRDELQMFRQLLEVSGIGPRVALGILSGSSPTDVLLAIQREDVTFLMRLPGIGKKTAQRMILDLKDKTKSMVVGDAVSTSAAGINQSAADPAGIWSEVKQALRALGYTEQECVRVVAQLRQRATEGDSLDALIKQALQLLFQGS